jgi:hypothetical protein
MLNKNKTRNALTAEEPLIQNTANKVQLETEQHISRKVTILTFNYSILKPCGEFIE